MIKKHINIHVGIGIGIIIISIVISSIISPKLAPEFSGTSRLVVRFPETTTIQVVQQAITNSATTATDSVQKIFSEITIQQENANFIFLAPAISEKAYLALDETFSKTFTTYDIISLESFSPTISQELIRRSFIAIIFASLIIIIFIGFAFRGVSRPMKSWKYGVVATVALVHDVAVPVGLFTILGLFTNAAVDVLFVTALLATLGYSINDTIVVFDRIRERLILLQKNKEAELFIDTVSKSVRKSVRRSIYTSLSTAIPLILVVYFVPVTQWFALTLCIGIVAGTYSSLFFAPSLLILWHRFFPQNDTTNSGEKNELKQAELHLRNRLHAVDTA